MKKREFNKIVKEYENDLQKLINKYINGELYFTQNELDIIIKKRGERTYKKRGGEK